MLWVDKYRPKTLDTLDFHPDLTKRLIRLGSLGDLPHLLFYGPSGGGKSTRIVALLKAIYGPGVENVKVEQRKFTLPSNNKTMELTTLVSNYHIVMTPSDAGNGDRSVVQEVIKEMASSVAIGSSVPFKVIVLKEVDSLSKGAQHALRRTMEKYGTVCRLILCCGGTSSIGQIIEPIRSRCLTMRVPAPSCDEICQCLQRIAKAEGVTLPDIVANRLSDDRNARKSILMFETLRNGHGSVIADDVEAPVSDWEQKIVTLAHDILDEQSPDRLLKVRGKLYELFGQCIPANIVLRRLTQEILRRCDMSLQHEVVGCAALYDERLTQGGKAIFHLEAFCARVMALHRAFLSMLDV